MGDGCPIFCGACECNGRWKFLATTGNFLEKTI